MRDPRQKDDIEFLRYYLKDDIRQEIYFEFTDQNVGIPMPPSQKYIPDGTELISLPKPDSFDLGYQKSVREAIEQRVSRRYFSNKALTREELSYLLWTTSGVRHRSASGRILRNTPSAGNRHSIECYLSIFNVEGIDAGLYRYVPSEHALLPLDSPEQVEVAVDDASLNQGFLSRSAVSFFWSTIPYRTEWRYAQASIKVIAMEAGHIAQNLYLAAESIGCACSVNAAYDQKKCDALFQLDGEDEFIIYMAALGKAHQSKQR